MAKSLKLLMVALFATMSFTLTSCGDDDEPSMDSKDYTFTIDDEVFYYGGGPFPYWPETILETWYSPNDDGTEIFFAITGQNAPLTPNEVGIPMYEGATKQAEIDLLISKFDPKTTKSGTVLNIYHIQDPWSEGSIRNRLAIHDCINNIRYATSAILSRDVDGVIKFISYEENKDEWGADYLTLEFENLTFYEEAERVYDESNDRWFTPLNKTKKHVVNGKIVFSSNLL
ncbi:MAG: hypothetical protein K2I34_00700 [Paramuribaculum sp.]|nr:hypothetical protein [Paramuribaculum sp.]